MIKKSIIAATALLLTTQGIPALEAAENPSQPDTTEIMRHTVDSFETLFGVTKGKRRNHTKGFCFEGTLAPATTDITKLSSSSLFSGVSTVVGRLSHKGGNNAAPDHKHADYGMGLAITSHTGETHLMSMNTLDFFPVATPEAFAELTAAQAEGKDAVKAFKANSPDLQRYKAHAAKQDKTLKPYEGTSYNSVNSFYLINDKDEKTAVRWSFVPAHPQALVVEPKQDFFLENMQQNLDKGEITWNMVVTLANEGDDVDNAAIPWEGDNQQIIAATLKVASVSSEEDGSCDVINYDPLVLSAGFAASNDPLLQARRNAYAVSFARRISEK